MTGYEDGPPTQIRVGGDIIVGVHGGLRPAGRPGPPPGHRARRPHRPVVDRGSVQPDRRLDPRLHRQRARPAPPGQREPRPCPAQLLSLPGGRPVGEHCGQDGRRVGGPGRGDGSPSAGLGRPTRRFATGRGRESSRGSRRIGGGHGRRGGSRRRSPRPCRPPASPAAPSFRAPDLFADPHVGSRDLLVTVAGPGARWPLVRLGGRLSATPLPSTGPARPWERTTTTIFGSCSGLPRRK